MKAFIIRSDHVSLGMTKILVVQSSPPCGSYSVFTFVDFLCMGCTLRKKGSASWEGRFDVPRSVSKRRLLCRGRCAIPMHFPHAEVLNYLPWESRRESEIAGVSSDSRILFYFDTVGAEAQ